MITTSTRAAPDPLPVVPDDVERFVAALFPTNEGLIELRALPSKARAFVPVGDEAGVAAFLEAHAAQNCYIGVATRRNATGGTLARCLDLHTVWIDLDFKDTPEAQARDQLASFALPPSVIVGTGGGLHCYWKVREPFELPVEGATVRALLRRLAIRFNADLASAEPARVLRLPTSRNFKYVPPRDVVLERCDDLAINASELEDWLPAEPVPKPNGGAAEPFQVPEQIQAGARNATLYRLGRALHVKGLSSAAIAAAVNAENAARCVPPIGQDELAAIVRQAIQQPDRADFVPDVQVTVDVASPLDPLDDAPAVAAEGQRLAVEGVPYLVGGLIPALGVLGMEVAYTKVGKTTWGMACGRAVAAGVPFLDRPTRQTRVLFVAAEDPPEYTAWLARHLDLPAGVLTFYRRPLVLDRTGLAQIAATVQQGGYGFVLIASWQAVVRGLIRDENDNAGAVRIVEAVKAVTRQTGLPWLIDAHSGKGEDQADDADPSKAMRGASGAAAAADFTLSLRYANGPFGSRRRLSGKGRFVNFSPLLLDYDDSTGSYTVLGSTKEAMTETTWKLIEDLGALTVTPQTADTIARAAGLVSAAGRVTGTGRRQVRDALRSRDGVLVTTETRRGQVTTLYARTEAQV